MNDVIAYQPNGDQDEFDAVRPTEETEAPAPPAPPAPSVAPPFVGFLEAKINAKLVCLSPDGNTSRTVTLPEYTVARLGVEEFLAIFQMIAQQKAQLAQDLATSAAAQPAG